MSKAEELAKWSGCASRGPWARNSLREAAQEMRTKEKRCRNAYTKSFMGDPAQYIADAYAEAATAFEARLAALEQAKELT